MEEIIDYTLQLEQIYTVLGSINEGIFFIILIGVFTIFSDFMFKKGGGKKW